MPLIPDSDRSNFILKIDYKLSKVSVLVLSLLMHSSRDSMISTLNSRKTDRQEKMKISAGEQSRDRVFE